MTARSSTDKDYDIGHIRQLALDAIPQSVLLCDATREDWPIIYCNPAFERLTGYRPDDVIGRNPRMLAGCGTEPVERGRMRDAILTGAPYSGTVINYRKDGSQFWNEITITTIEEGDERYFIGVHNDVTDRLTLETSLRESQKMEALGKLSGGIAHDFNNILALILGNAELIAADEHLSPLVQSAASDIVEAAEGGANLIARMLRFARGQESLAKPVALNHAIRNALMLLSRTMGTNIRLEHDLSDAVGSVHVDRTLFESALINLFVNARDAMDGDGTVLITTCARTDSELGLVAAITIFDSGSGMDEETRARAFEPFFTTKHGGRGTGLGLSMVYRFVEQSGGRIAIVSAPGEGTSVEILLPMIDDRALTDQSSHRPRVLIVDDEAKVRKMIALHLFRAGYACSEAADAVEALAKLREDDRADLMVSDIRLGAGMSGIDLVAAARALHPDLPILLTTGFAAELENPPEHIAGVPVLRKPFRAKTLVDAVEEMRAQAVTAR